MLQWSQCLICSARVKVKSTVFKGRQSVYVCDLCFREWLWEREWERAKGLSQCFPTFWNWITLFSQHNTNVTRHRYGNVLMSQPNKNILDIYGTNIFRNAIFTFILLECAVRRHFKNWIDILKKKINEPKKHHLLASNWRKTYCLIFYPIRAPVTRQQQLRTMPRVGYVGATVA